MRKRLHNTSHDHYTNTSAHSNTQSHIIYMCVCVTRVARKRQRRTWNGHDEQQHYVCTQRWQYLTAWLTVRYLVRQQTYINVNFVYLTNLIFILFYNTILKFFQHSVLQMNDSALDSPLHECCFCVLVFLFWYTFPLFATGFSLLYNVYCLWTVCRYFVAVAQRL